MSYEVDASRWMARKEYVYVLQRNAAMAGRSLRILHVNELQVFCVPIPIVCRAKQRKKWKAILETEEEQEDNCSRSAS